MDMREEILRMYYDEYLTPSEISLALSQDINYVLSVIDK